MTSEYLLHQESAPEAGGRAESLGGQERKASAAVRRRGAASAVPGVIPS